MSKLFINNRYWHRLGYAIALLLGLLCTTQANASEQPLDGVAAIVNNAVITQSQVRQQMGKLKQQLAMNHQHYPAIEVLHKQALEILIDQALQLQIAHKANLTVSEQQLNQAITDIAKRNGVSLAQLQQQLESQGLSFNAYRQQIRQEILMSQVQQHEVGQKIHISEAEIDHAMQTLANQPSVAGPSYDPKTQYHLQDMLLPLTASASAEKVSLTLKKAILIAQQLNAGASLKAIKKQYPFLHTEDLGWRRADQLPGLFVQVLSELTPQKVSPPFKAPNGIHLLKLLAINGARLPSPSANTLSLRDRAQQVVFQRKFQAALEPWLLSLRQQSYVRIYQ